MLADSIACAEAVLAEHPGNLEALMHVAQIYATQGYHAELVRQLNGSASHRRQGCSGPSSCLPAARLPVS